MNLVLKREKETPPAATISYMICAETAKIRALTVELQWVWRAYKPFIPPQAPNLMLQAGSADLDPPFYKFELGEKSHG